MCKSVAPSSRVKGTCDLRHASTVNPFFVQAIMSGVWKEGCRLAFACAASERLCVILTADQEPEDPEMAAQADAETATRLRPCGLAVHDTSTNTVLSSWVLDEPAGTVMPVGETHAVAFYKHPRLIRLSDGAVEHTWPAISSGTELSSITWGRPVPPLALDPAKARFAIAQEHGIHVVSLGTRSDSARQNGG